MWEMAQGSTKQIGRGNCIADKKKYQLAEYITQYRMYWLTNVCTRRWSIKMRKKV